MDSVDIHQTTENDDVSLFEDSLGTLFGHVQPALCNPGGEFTYKSLKHGPLKIRVPEQEVNTLFAHYLWRASLVMAGYIDRGELDLHNETVLEVGCGTGLPSILATLHGAALVVPSDYDEPKLINTIRNNISSTLDEATRKRCRVMPHTWGTNVDDIQDLSPSFTRILSADCLWSEYGHADLVKSITRLLAKTPEAKVIVVAGFHTGREIVVRFFDRCKMNGLCWIEHPMERNVNGEERPFTEDQKMETQSEKNSWLVTAHLKWQEDRLS